MQLYPMLVIIIGSSMTTMFFVFISIAIPSFNTIPTSYYIPQSQTTTTSIVI